MAIVESTAISTGQTKRNIRQNLFFASCYNMAGVPIAGRGALSVYGYSYIASVCPLQPGRCPVSVVILKSF